MYWPKELPSATQYDTAGVEGRLPCHGTKELIASNHRKSHHLRYDCARLTNNGIVDIIDATSVAKHVRVNYWNGKTNGTPPKTLYWRHFLDVQVNRLVDFSSR